MSIDLSQFFEVFFEESFEGLDIMEAQLLKLQPEETEKEIINNIFRAAHSIKGSSGTFGFTAVADFTHVLETLLEQIRDGYRPITEFQIGLFLQSVDCIRIMLIELRDNKIPNLNQANQLKEKLETLLATDAESTEYHTNKTKFLLKPISGHQQPSTQLSKKHNVVAVEKHTWTIIFVPAKDILKTGNEPILILQALAELGTLSVNVNISSVPNLDEIDPELCYFSWRLTLHSNCTKAQIDEIFEWIVDDCHIQVKQHFSLSQNESENENREVSPPSLINVHSDQTVNPPLNMSAISSSTQADINNKASNREYTQIESSSSIRVSIEKVDSLINMVGELVITQAMLAQLSEGELDKAKLLNLQAGLAQLANNTRDLQESVMRIRMLPIGSIFSRFSRLVNDTSKKLGKKIELNLLGEQTELDKTLMEKISDPLVHLVRNAIDHGIESPAERLAAGKSEKGVITLNAYHHGGHIVIEIMDDGRGLDTQKIKEKAIAHGLIETAETLTDEQINLFVFKPGFSTIEQISELSGRGVGMDVVKRNVQALNGSVELSSVPKKGSVVTIRLPLTLAILEGQLIKVGQHIYIIPVMNIIESLQININKVNSIGGEVEVIKLRDEFIPIVRLYQLFAHQPINDKLDKGLLVVVESDNQKIGILVDELLSQQQIVIKSLETNYCKVDGIASATILGDGTVSLILDVHEIIQLAGLARTTSLPTTPNINNEQVEV